MSLFQKSVLNKYLKTLNQDEVEKAWVKYSRYFHNDIVQETIRNSKEEEYQAIFLDDLFVNILGYTLKPRENFNLVLEQKNLKNSKKADGAILKDGKVISVIELKGTDTTDLSKVETQAFGYKNNQPDAKYVVTSNFEKLRFYIDNTIDYEEFNLFTLTRERFELLYICLQLNNIQSDLPKKIKYESVSQDEAITKKLYKDYSSFRSELFDSIQKLNPDYDKLTLFKKTQKLLDRFLFIFFAEDRLLIQPNTISKIVNKWKTLQEEFDEYFPLYNRFKKYFNYLNDGYKNEVFAYNGGLFAHDEILDSIKIDDNVLERHTLKLTAYDFESDVDVNIIGHIFEHSLNEIEEIQAELDGKILDKSKSKRKRDGVFYTPKYITKYIVDNTVGKLCEDKKNELGIIEEEYEKERKGRKKDTLKKLIGKLESYRTWLLQITICDPACGSGAFLNQALEFLILEHSYIDELQSKLLGEGFVIQNIENEILEHNLFGVDINEEAVEIAKLSLWLRTARKGRKLTSLSDNIKCGNSLVSDPEVAGEKAFDWEKEFPEIFQKGGFDIVIGNPPYVVQKQDSIYKTYSWGSDLYLMFFELVFKNSIIRENGLFGFITPRFFAVNKNCKEFREFLLTDVNLISLLETAPFADADTECLVSIIKNSENKSDRIDIYEDINGFMSNLNTISKDYCLNNMNYEIQTYLDPITIELIMKIENNTIVLDSISTSRRGMEIGKKDFIESGIRTLVGYDTTRYNVHFDDNYVELSNKQYQRLKEFFEIDKLILLRRVSSDLVATLVDDNYAFNKNLYGINVQNENYGKFYILSLLNSRLLNFYYKKKFSMKKIDLFPEIQSYLFKLIPIKKISISEQSPFEENAIKILKYNKELERTLNKFTSLLQSEFNLEHLSKKLKNWWRYDWLSFTSELKKIKIELRGENKEDWKERFDRLQSEAISIQSSINQTNKEIDDMVYMLYGLTEEEIKIIEESFNEN